MYDPDIAGWRVERVPDLPEENPIAIVPDWEKLPGYAAAGVPHIWIVDPEKRLVQVFVPVDGRPSLLTTADEEALRLPPFDLDVDPRRWWIEG